MQIEEITKLEFIKMLTICHSGKKSCRKLSMAFSIVRALDTIKISAETKELPVDPFRNVSASVKQNNPLFQRKGSSKPNKQSDHSQQLSAFSKLMQVRKMSSVPKQSLSISHQ